MNGLWKILFGKTGKQSIQNTVKSFDGSEEDIMEGQYRTPICGCGSAAIAARGQVAGDFQKSQ